MTSPAAPSESAEPSRAVRRISPWKKAVVVALVLVGCRQIVKGYFVEGFKISTAAIMQPSVEPGDFFFVRKDAYGLVRHGLPERGDVIVFRAPDQGEKDTVSRVIGLPGDTIRIEGGAVSVNGFRVATCVAGPAKNKVGEEERSFIIVVELLGDRAYLVAHDEVGLQKREHHTHDDEHAHDHDHGAGVEGPFKVRENEVFVLGDNRENADDSRSWGDMSGVGVPLDHIKGRAGIIWMSNDDNGALRRARLGLSLNGEPYCPAWVPAETCAAAERCLTSRPSRETVTPPPAASGLSK